MAVTDEFRAQWLECQDEYGKNIEDGDMPVIGIDEVDDTISLPAVRFTAPFNPSGENVFSGYAHVPMKTFKKKIDDLAGEVSEATSGLSDLRRTAAEAADDAADAAENARDATTRAGQMSDAAESAAAAARDAATEAREAAESVQKVATETAVRNIVRNWTP